MTTTTLGQLRANHSIEQRPYVADIDCLPDDHPVEIRDGWYADDGNAEVHYDDAETGREAAQEYVDDSDYGDVSETDWVDVYAWRKASLTVTDEDGEPITVSLDIDRDSYTIEIEPTVPECAEGHEHEWLSPYSILGGLRENPGVWGSGGGVIIKCVCAHCGRYHITDTWAHRPDTGEQGLTSVSYADADEDSSAWVERRAA